MNADKSCCDGYFSGSIAYEIKILSALFGEHISLDVRGIYSIGVTLDTIIIILSIVPIILFNILQLYHFRYQYFLMLQLRSSR